MTAIDLSQIAAPDVVETLDFETLLAAVKETLIGLAPDLEAVLSLESEPAVKILEVMVYREMLLRARVNDGARAVMLPTATGADLENLAAFYGVTRLVVTPADTEAVPPVAAVMESDARLRTRTQMALEGFSTAGPRGAYEFHALSADGAVLDVGVTSPTPGEVVVSILSNVGNGAASAELLATVNAVLTDETVRPLTDHVTVQSAAIVTYTIEAAIYCYSGPDRAVVLAASQASAEAYVAAQRKIGRDVTLSGIYAALHGSGVQRVDLAAPAASIVIGETEAAHCTAITLTDGGTDE